MNALSTAEEEAGYVVSTHKLKRCIKNTKPVVTYSPGLAAMRSPHKGTGERAVSDTASDYRSARGAGVLARKG